MARSVSVFFFVFFIPSLFLFYLSLLRHSRIARNHFLPRFVPEKGFGRALRDPVNPVKLEYWKTGFAAAEVYDSELDDVTNVVVAYITSPTIRRNRRRLSHVFVTFHLAVTLFCYLFFLISVLGTLRGLCSHSTYSQQQRKPLSKRSKLTSLSSY